MSKLAAIRAAARLNDDAEIEALVNEAEAPVAFNAFDRDSLIRKTGMKTASEYQIDIFRHVAENVQKMQQGETPTNLAVEAVAGSGKTTTIVAASKLIPRNMKAIFLAFNKSIATELGERLPRHVEARTLNSLGMRVLCRYLGSQHIRLDAEKGVSKDRTSRIIREMFPRRQDREAFQADVEWIVGMCKSIGVVPHGVNDGMGVNGTTDSDNDLLAICRHHGRHIDPMIRNRVFSITRRVLAQSWSEANIRNNAVIDYNDQKWLTVCKRPAGRTLAQPQYDVVIIDEVQDVNLVDIELLKLVLKPGGMVIGVGDSKQAIYGFRGADTGAFSSFVGNFDAKVQPLSITYRCGKALVANAQKIVPTIEAAPGAQEGEVTHWNEYKATDFQPGDLVMCRNNAPLVSFAYGLIRNRVPVKVLGRDIGRGLVRLIEELVGKTKWVPNPKKPGKKMPVADFTGVHTDELREALTAYSETQCDKIRREDPDNGEAIQKIMDNVACILVFVNGVADGKVTTVVNEIESVFTDNENQRGKVICATVHKAKGLEADRAFLFAPNLLYPAWVQKAWQVQQEANIDYIARTRGKSLYCTLSEDGLL